MNAIFEKLKKMTWAKKILWLCLIFIIVFLLTNLKLVIYGVEQGIGELEMVHNAVPIDSLLKDPDYPDSLKQKLLIIKEVRRFAIDSLGLKDSPNFQSVYDLKGRATAYVVQGCEKYRIKKYLWKFPVVGKLPYKGFFDENDAKKEAQQLENQDYDVRIVHPASWSTMGWFKDPVLSNMLYRDEAYLAELIIHELTHSTIFVKDNSELNENIADYCGECGAATYLKSKYGDTSKVLQNYFDVNRDNDYLAFYFIKSAKKLDSLYSSNYFLSLSDSAKDDVKQNYIQNVINNLDTLDFRVINVSKLKDGRLKNINNTFFTGYLTYYNHKDSLRLQLADFDGDFLKQLAFFKQKYGR